MLSPSHKSPPTLIGFLVIATRFLTLWPINWPTKATPYPKQILQTSPTFWQISCAISRNLCQLTEKNPAFFCFFFAFFFASKRRQIFYVVHCKHIPDVRNTIHRCPHIIGNPSLGFLFVKNQYSKSYAVTKLSTCSQQKQVFLIKKLNVPGSKEKSQRLSDTHSNRSQDSPRTWAWPHNLFEQNRLIGSRDTFLMHHTLHLLHPKLVLELVLTTIALKL